jgi:hypothetical protein
MYTYIYRIAYCIVPLIHAFILSL